MRSQGASLVPPVEMSVGERARVVPSGHDFCESRRASRRTWQVELPSWSRSRHPRADPSQREETHGLFIDRSSSKAAVVAGVRVAAIATEIARIPCPAASDGAHDAGGRCSGTLVRLQVSVAGATRLRDAVDDATKAADGRGLSCRSRPMRTISVPNGMTAQSSRSMIVPVPRPPPQHIVTSA
jgi:hypothetical protein